MYVEKERGNYMDQTYMKEQPVLKLILSMALPMVLSMMVSSLYNIVDSFFIARISEDAMTALSVLTPAVLSYMSDPYNFPFLFPHT